MAKNKNKKKKIDNKRSKCIHILSLWMIGSILPGSYYYIAYGVDFRYIAIAILEWGFYFCMVKAALGLWDFQEWARIWAIRLFGIYFFWTIATIYLLSGNSFNMVMESYSNLLHIPEDPLKIIVVVVLLVHVLWPVLAVYLLTYPKVRRIFAPDYDPEKEAQEEAEDANFELQKRG